MSNQAKSLQKIITIVGGQGQMGKLFSTYWKNLGATLRSLDINDWVNAKSLLQDCDLAVICVPINKTIAIIQQITPYLPKSAILADFTSIKTAPILAMLDSHTGPVLGLHPMFGPSIPSPTNQVIINCGGRQSYQWVIDSLLAIGFTLTDMESNNHDQAMTFIQGIEHFSTFILGTFLRSHGQHPHELFNLASPIYQAKLALMGRIFDQDAALYADIITADENRMNLINEYAKYFNSWVTKLREHKTDEFIHEFQQTAKWMGSFTHQAQLASDQFLATIADSFQDN